MRVGVCSVAPLCLTLCDPMDCSLPVFSAHGIFQATMLELVAIPTLGDIPDPGIKFASLVSSTFTPNAAVKPQVGSLSLVPLGKATE